MSKIDVSVATEIMKKHKLEPSQLRAIVEEMQLLTQKDDAGEEKEPPVKKQFSILLSDPEGKLPKGDLVGWVIQMPEGESPLTVPDRVFRASYDFNASKRGALLPVKSVGESLEATPSKYFKEADIWVKTKTPVHVIVTDNILPREGISVDHRKKPESV